MVIADSPAQRLARLGPLRRAGTEILAGRRFFYSDLRPERTTLASQSHRFGTS